MTAANRPTSITVLSILNLVVGASGIIYAVFGVIVSLLFKVPINELPEPMRGVEDIVKIGYLFGTIEGFVSIVVGLIAIISGIGLLQMTSWARGSAYGYAIAAIANNVIGAIFALIIQIIVFTRGFVPAPAVALGLGIVSNVIFTVLFCAYPIVLLFFLRTPTWKRAFATPVPRLD